jgi:hypothetical protein
MKWWRSNLFALETIKQINIRQKSHARDKPLRKTAANEIKIPQQLAILGD